MTGDSRGVGTNDDITTIKYDAGGVQQWVARFNGAGNFNDLGRGVAVDASGNVYVTGQSLNAAANADMTTIKYDAAGTQKWVMTYDGPGNYVDGGNDVALDLSGNIYVTGGSYGTANGDCATIKYNPNGETQWVARYNGGSQDSSARIVVGGAGDVYIAGQTYNSGSYSSYLTIRYTPTPAVIVGGNVSAFTNNGAAGFALTAALTNTGGLTAGNVQVTSAMLGSASTTTPLPLVLGDVPSQANGFASLTFPSSAGTTGQVVWLRITGKQNGVTFSISKRVTLP